jgi:hypothetical protein
VIQNISALFRKSRSGISTAVHSNSVDILRKLLSLVGLFWKKKYRYTVIEYNDGIQDQTVILDFHKEANKAQRIIYSQMAGARQKQKAESEQKALTDEQKVLTESEQKALTEQKAELERKIAELEEEKQKREMEKQDKAKEYSEAGKRIRGEE